MFSIEDMLKGMNRLRTYYGRMIKDKIPGYAFSPNEISILILLKNNPSLNTSTDLRVVLGVSKSLVSRSVDALVKKGLVHLSNDLVDKRVVHIELTKEAKPVLDKIQEEVNLLYASVFHDVTQEELDAMKSVFDKVDTYLEEVDHEK